MADFWKGTTSRLVNDAMQPTVKWRVVPVKQHLYGGWAIFRNGRRMWTKRKLEAALAYIRRHT
jgi:hypothetical protein